jgi:hypothetical protein
MTTTAMQPLDYARPSKSPIRTAIAFVCLVIACTCALIWIARPERILSINLSDGTLLRAGVSRGSLGFALLHEMRPTAPPGPPFHLAFLGFDFGYGIHRGFDLGSRILSYQCRINEITIPAWFILLLDCPILIFLWRRHRNGVPTDGRQLPS